MAPSVDRTSPDVQERADWRLEWLYGQSGLDRIGVGGGGVSLQFGARPIGIVAH